MSATYSPSRDLPLDLRVCACGAKTMAPDGQCAPCALAAFARRRAEHRALVTEIHTSLRRIVYAGVIHGRKQS